MVSTAIPIPLAQPAKSSRRRLLLRAFYAGPENLLANQAYESLATNQDRFNPIVLHGPAGTGKSQLTQCIAQRWKLLHPNTPLLELSSAEFARQYNDAIRSDLLGDFRESFKNLGLFVLEDLGLLTSKPATQQELRYLFDQMLHAGTSIVVTSHAPPSTLAGLLPALASRLAMGLTVPLAKPRFLARQAMLRDATEPFPARISAKAIDVLAHEPHLSAAEMLAAAESLLSAGRSIGVEEAYGELRTRTESAAISPAAILRTTAAYFRIKLRTLKSASRNRQVVTARGVAIYLMRLLTSESLEKIGQRLGNRDHTTILHNARKMERLSRMEPEIQEAITTIQHQLT